MSFATPKGFRFAGIHAGIKVARRDLALIESDTPAHAAGVMTQNQVHASCVDRPGPGAVGIRNRCKGVEVQQSIGSIIVWVHPDFPREFQI